MLYSKELNTRSHEQMCRLYLDTGSLLRVWLKCNLM